MQLPVNLQASQDALSAALRKINLRIIPLMFVLYIVSYLDRINVSYAGLEMNKDLGFNSIIFGVGGGVFFIGYFLFGVPSNLMVQKLGPRKWISTIMMIWGLLSMSTSLVQTKEMFFLVRFLLGIAEAGFFPGMILYLTYWFPKKEHGMAVAKFMAAIPVAGILGGKVAAFALGLNGAGAIAGWKWLFIMTGGMSFLFGVIVRFILLDGPQSAGWLSEVERTALSQKLAEEKAANGSANSQSAKTDIMQNPRVWLFSGIYFCLTLGMYGFTLWLPLVLASYGKFDHSQIADMSIIPAIFQGLGMLVVAKSSDNTGDRRWHLAASTALAAIGLITCAYSHDIRFAVASLSLAAFGIWGSVGPFWALPTTVLSPAVAAAGIALINSVGNLGGFAGPSLVGLVREATSNFGYALSAMALPLLLAGGLALAFTRTPAKMGDSP